MKHLWILLLLVGCTAVPSEPLPAFPEVEIAQLPPDFWMECIPTRRESSNYTDPWKEGVVIESAEEYEAFFFPKGREYYKGRFPWDSENYTGEKPVDWEYRERKYGWQEAEDCQDIDFSKYILVVKMSTSGTVVGWEHHTYLDDENKQIIYTTRATGGMGQTAMSRSINFVLVPRKPGYAVVVKEWNELVS